MQYNTDFLNVVASSTYHIVSGPVATVRDYISNKFAGSIPVSSDREWYSVLGTDAETDVFTAWYNYTCHSLAINPSTTDEDLRKKVFAKLAGDLIRYQGWNDDTNYALDAIYAVVVGGAEFINLHGYYPVKGDHFVATYQRDRRAALVLGYVWEKPNVAA